MLLHAALSLRRVQVLGGGQEFGFKRIVIYLEQHEYTLMQTFCQIYSCKHGAHHKFKQIMPLCFS